MLAVDSDCKMCTRQDGLTVNGLQSLRDYMKIAVVVVAGAQPYLPPKKKGKRNKLDAFINIFIAHCYPQPPYSVLLNIVRLGRFQPPNE